MSAAMEIVFFSGIAPVDSVAEIREAISSRTTELNIFAFGIGEYKNALYYIWQYQYVSVNASTHMCLVRNVLDKKQAKQQTFDVHNRS